MAAIYTKVCTECGQTKRIKKFELCRGAGGKLYRRNICTVCRNKTKAINKWQRHLQEIKDKYYVKF